MAKSKKGKLPANVMKRLAPFIDRGIQNGIFTDEQQVVDLYRRRAKDESIQDALTALGGIRSKNGQNFVTDCVLTDLSAILRQKRYTAHMNVWECRHTTVGAAKGNPRPAAFLYGQTVIDTGDETMEPAMFRMSLWDEDAIIADDVVSGGTYAVNVSCRNLDLDILDLRPLSGLTNFSPEDYDHEDPEKVLRETFEISPIAELEDDISRSPSDFRLVEATISYAGSQTSRTGNAFGKVMLKDDSTMTMDAIESGENLLLNCITSTDIAERFGRYSRILGLVTTKMNGEWGLSANLEVAIGLVVVSPPEPEVDDSGDDGADDATTYFTDDDDDDDETETVEATVDEAPKEKKAKADADDDDGWSDDDWE